MTERTRAITKANKAHSVAIRSYLEAWESSGDGKTSAIIKAWDLLTETRRALRQAEASFDKDFELLPETKERLAAKPKMKGIKYKPLTEAERIKTFRLMLLEEHNDMVKRINATPSLIVPGSTESAYLAWRYMGKDTVADALNKQAQPSLTQRQVKFLTGLPGWKEFDAECKADELKAKALTHRQQIGKHVKADKRKTP